MLGKEPTRHPANAAEFDRYVAYNKDLREDCRRRTGPVFDHASTAEVARDIEEIRRALGAFAGIFCNEYDLRVRSYREYKTLVDLETRVAPHVPGSVLGHGAMMACLGFPPASNPQRDLKIRNAPKILLTNAVHDPATPYSWAENAHRQSRDSTVFVTYEGWGHGVYSASPCGRAITDRYLLELSLPADGTRCPAFESPDTASGKAQTGPWAVRGWGRVSI